MKKMICLLAILSIGIGSFAQENDSFKAKTIQLVKMTSGQQFDVMTEPLVNMVPAENKEAFKKELKESTSDLYAQIAAVYMEEFTEEEVEQILAFYDTPVGSKMVAVTPKLTKKGMEIGQAWGMQLQPLTAKYTK